MTRIHVLLAFVFAIVAADFASAQSRSLFGSSGPVGQSSLGTSSSLGSRSSSTGQGSSLGSTLGTTGSNMPSLNIGGTSPFAASSTELSGQSGFVGRSDNAGRFVGNAQTDQGTAGSSRQNFNAGSRQNFTGNRQAGNTGLNQQQFGNFNNANAGNAQRGTLRPQQRIAFNFTPRPAPQVTQALHDRFQTLIGTPALRGISIVQPVAGTVVLRGQVRDEDSRKLAAMLARLEPGVRTVQNELVVSP